MAVAERFGTRWPPSSEFFFVVAVLLVLLTGEPRNRCCVFLLTYDFSTPIASL
jgi:hypothetical protein